MPDSGDGRGSTAYSAVANVFGVTFLGVQQAVTCSDLVQACTTSRLTAKPIYFLGHCDSPPCRHSAAGAGRIPRPTGRPVRHQRRAEAGRREWLPADPCAGAPRLEGGWVLCTAVWLCPDMTSRWLTSTNQLGSAAQKIDPAFDQQVLHVPDIDFNSTVWTFVEGLQAIKVPQ
jgi:hypothetical protein